MAKRVISPIDTGPRDINYPFHEQLGKLRDLGVTIPPREQVIYPMRERADTYHMMMMSDTARNEPLHITREVAEVIAGLLADKRLSSIEIPYVSALDEDAKPILASAIHRYRGIFLSMAGEKPRNAQFKPEIADWFEERLSKANNPNLAISSGRNEALEAITRENREEATHAIQVMTENPREIDRKLCVSVAKRLPLILYKMDSHGRGINLDQAIGLFRLQAVAKTYNIPIELPEEVVASAKARADILEEGWTPHSWASLVAPQAVTPNGDKYEVHRNWRQHDGERVSRSDDFLHAQTRWQDEEQVNVAKAANRYPAPPRSR